MADMIATRAAYGKALAELGEKHADVVVLDADLSKSTMTAEFAKRFPERFVQMGISEQDMMATAAGIATMGKKVFASTFAIFAAGRAYDQVRNSIAYSGLDVKVCATHAGLSVGEDGASHQMVEDLALMRALPNMTVLCPSDAPSTKWAVEAAYQHHGPVYVRLGRAPVPQYHSEGTQFAIGKSV
ncbi:MAG TPA: transketolase family protein, partial [Bacillota bacterium]|nr:transketolase family protein [Bacillota bacterium]